MRCSRGVAATAQSVDEVVLKTVAVILKSFGLQEEDTREIRLDFQCRPRWRKTTEQIERPLVLRESTGLFFVVFFGHAFGV